MEENKGMVYKNTIAFLIITCVQNSKGVQYLVYITKKVEKKYGHKNRYDLF